MHTEKVIMDYRAADFDLSRAPTYHLIIDGTLLNEPVLVFLDQKSVLKCTSTYAGYEQLFPEYPLSGLVLNSLSFVIPAIDVQYFPEVVYEEELQESYGRYLLDDGVTPLKSVRIPSLGVVALYREDLTGLSDLTGLFPQAERRVLAPLILQNLAVHFEHQQESGLHIHRSVNSVIMTIFNDGKFIYQRDFQCHNEDEFNYHLINMLTLSDQHAATLNVYLSGAIAEGDSFYDRVTKYCQQIQVAGFRYL